MICDDTRDAIFEVGHRAFVGGTDDFHWNAIGLLQFDFLKAQGLRPSHVLYDIACGSLRGGVHFIRYLDEKNYAGFDKYVELVIMGVGQELGFADYMAKKPFFHIGTAFRFDATERRPDFAISQSLFTHLTPADIGLCLAGLKQVALPGFRFFTTFFEVPLGGHANPTESHSHEAFYYSKEEMTAFGAQNGFTPVYHGAWNHPRGQMMFEYALR